MDVKEKMRKGVNFTILHQGLIFGLYQFHLALVPHRIVAVDIPTHPNPQPQIVPLRITGLSAPTPQPSHSGSLVNPTPMGKRGRQDKGKERAVEELEEEGRGGRRRLGRLAKCNAKRKLKVGAS